MHPNVQHRHALLLNHGGLRVDVGRIDFSLLQDHRVHLPKKTLAKIPHLSTPKALIHTGFHDSGNVKLFCAAGALARIRSEGIPELLELISKDDVHTATEDHGACAIIAFRKHSFEALMEGLRHSNVFWSASRAVVSALGALTIGDSLPKMGDEAVLDWAKPDGMSARGLRVQ